MTKRALFIQRTLSTRAAAGYLRNRGVGYKLALCVLCYWEKPK